jgi:hypothetical protein
MVGDFEWTYSPLLNSVILHLFDIFCGAPLESPLLMSTILKADATGAVTLPADLCRAAGVAPGAEIVAEIESGRIVLVSAPQTLAERIVARALALPPDALDGLPDDLVAQHDHYLYETPKQPESTDMFCGGSRQTSGEPDGSLATASTELWRVPLQKMDVIFERLQNQSPRPATLS